EASRLRGGEADSLYNAGNAHYQAGRLEEALTRYDQALESDPDHARAAHNRELLVQELEMRRQQQPPPPPPQQGQGGESQQPRDGDPSGQPQGGQGQQDPSQGQGQEEAPESQGRSGGE